LKLHVVRNDATHFTLVPQHQYSEVDLSCAFLNFILGNAALLLHVKNQVVNG